MLDFEKHLVYNNSMEEEKFKKNIAQNLINYRKQNGLTQLELAEKLNYSDKAISKWERGESFPDITVLCSIAELYNITINDLVSEQKVGKVKFLTQTPNKIRLCLLTTGLVFFIATIIFSILTIWVPSVTKAWLSFIYAIPISSIVLLVFSAIWRKRGWQFIFVTVLVWTLCLSLYLTMLGSAIYLFIIAAPFEALVVIWFLKLKK